VQLVRKLPAFHGTQSSLPHSQTSATCIQVQTNRVHIPTSYLLEICPNSIHPSTPRSPQWSPSLRFPHLDPMHPLSSPISAICPAHFILQINSTILGEQYKSFSSLWNLLHSAVISSLLSNTKLYPAQCQIFIAEKSVWS